MSNNACYKSCMINDSLLRFAFPMPRQSHPFKDKSKENLEGSCIKTFKPYGISNKSRKNNISMKNK